MCMCGTVKKEKEDFKKLYEGIKNDVVRERIRASGEWYIVSDEYDYVHDLQGTSN